MPLRTRIFIITSLAFLFVLSLAIIIYVRSRGASKQEENTPAPVVIDSSSYDENGVLVKTNISKPTEIPKGVPVKPATSKEAEEAGLKSLAETFVERYNTYSTDNPFQNIRDVEKLVTPVYWKKISAPLVTKAPTNSGFVGVTTKVESVSGVQIDASTAVVSLQAIRTSQNGSTTTSKNESYKVTLQKAGTKWLVDGYQK